MLAPFLYVVVMGGSLAPRQPVSAFDTRGSESARRLALMVNWYLNPALTRFRSAVDRRWPNRDRTSDGTIGDAAHQARSSDHNPDADGSVDAWDMDKDGVDPWLCISVFEQHESAGYWIHNDLIAHRATGWKRESYAYAGPDRNRHLQHVHFNTRPAGENSTAPWNLDVAPDTGEHPAGSRTLRLAAPRLFGADVSFVQRWIGDRAGRADGVYGPQTEAGVRWYQTLRGIPADGVLGPQTWAQMGIQAR